MQWGWGCHIWCKHKEIKTYRCYFLCSVVLQYIFFYFCCLNERNIVVLFHHQRPFDFSPPCLKQVDAASFCFFVGFFCLFVTQRWFLHALSPHTIAISRFCGPHRNVGMRRGCRGGTVGSVYRSKDAALCCRDHGCNIKTVDTRWRRGQCAPNPSTKVFIGRKVGKQSIPTSAASKEIACCSLVFPSSVIMHSLRLWPLV